jgi:hypothetical protein
MFTNQLQTQSISKASVIRYTTRLLLVASILAGFTTACATTAQSASIDPVVGNTKVQASELLSLNETIDISPQTNQKGHDFGAIYGSVDPGANQIADPVGVLAPAHGPGHDFGAIYGASDPGAILSVDPVEVTVPANSPGHDFGAIYGAVDPGKNHYVDLPPFTYTFNGITVVRRSELGPLTETVDNYLQASVP